MKAKIAAWLMSLALTINGGPVEPVETETLTTSNDIIIVETFEVDSSIPEYLIAEECDSDEHEGQIFEVQDTKIQKFKEALKSTRIAVADAASVTFGNAKDIMQKIGDRMIFWD